VARQAVTYLKRRAFAARALAVVLLVGGCRAAPPELPPTPTVPPPPTATPLPPPTPVPTPQVDPVGAIVARQTDLQTFRQALSLDVDGIGPGGRPTTMRVWAEGESARPNSRLHVGTTALGMPMGFVVLQIDRQLYLNPFGTWLAVEAQALPPGLPLIPIPLAADPQALLPLFAGAQVTPDLGVPVRGVSTDVLRFTLPPDRAEALTQRLFLSQTVQLLQGRPTYTEAGGELAVGRDDGFVRRVALLLRGYSDGDPARTFSIQSRTELWDVNGPTLTVAPPTEPVFQLPSPNARPTPPR
jgi:hypothetical protein